MRYFKRPWSELRGDKFDSWGTSVWLFEVDAKLAVLRQLEVYANGVALKYDAARLDDHFGGLADQPLELSAFAAFEIAQREFDETWSKTEAINA